MYLSELTRRKPDWWSSDPHARALEREAGSACTGVRVLQRLTRLTPVQRQLLAEKKIRVIPLLFAMKRTIDAERKAGDPRWREHQRVYEANVAKGWGKGYVLTNEPDELARARCELARAKVEAWKVLSPAAVAAKIARVPTTQKERIERRVGEMLKAPSPQPRPKRSLSQLFWRKLDDRLDSAMQRARLPAKLRGPVRKAVHAAIEKGTTAALGKSLEALGVRGEAKEAIEGIVRAAAQRRDL